MKASELRDMEDDELREHIAGQRRELLGLRFQQTTAALDNTSSLGRTRREIARALTVAREREIAAATRTETEETDG